MAPEDVQDQVGWNSEQTGLVEGVLPLVEELEINDFCGHFQGKPFCEYIIV